METVDRSMKGFPERIYVSARTLFTGYRSVVQSVAVETVDHAVEVGEPVKVGIYQLVRVAKFQKKAIEVHHELEEVR